MPSILSSLEQKPINRDVAVTRGFSLQGKVKPVWGVYKKVNGAKLGDVKKVIIPRENLEEISEDLKGIEIIPVSCITEVISY